MRKVAKYFDSYYWLALVMFGVVAGLIPVLAHFTYVYGYGVISGRELSFSMGYLKTIGFTISFLSGFFAVALMTLGAAQSHGMHVAHHSEPRNPDIIKEGVVIAGVAIVVEIVFMLFVADEFSPVFFFSPAVKAFAGVMTGTLRQIV